MYLKHLSLTNFRNFARLDLDVPRRVVVLVGSNAQGKTSLLEAVYFMAAFTSFQTHADRQLVNFIAAREARKQVMVGRLVADFQRGKSDHRLEARLILEPTGVNGVRLRKEVLLDGVKRSLSDVIGQFNAVVFVPQMSQILEGGPDERRRYLNLALAQTIPSYMRALSEYNQALSQRNALLKALNENGRNSEQLSAWDEALARLGAQIILWRIQALQEIERLAARVHHELTRSKEVLRLSYEPAFDPLPQPEGQLGLKMDTPVDRSGLELEEIRAGFVEKLARLRREEIARGMTTIGPHRDELRFLANGIDLGDYGSRGQIRTALLALKMAEVNWMKERTGEWPVILLDEVMAELDLERRADLLAYLGQREQVLFTTTDLNLFAPGFVQNAEVWDVHGGTVTPRRDG
ncbi:MAG: DNA replication/repair protein RecF [Anaerolineales bacterium]|nr:DNA replication/repair protein RecF [Anaerolineales bacterium]